MMEKLISIIVPIYNSEKFLSRCIESIINQTYRNIELILINDGSRDKSLDICNKYKKYDNRIIVIDKENEGVSATRNLGIKTAKGDYIGFVDSDDYIDKDMYKILVGLIEKDQSQAAVLARYTINKNIQVNSTISKSDALNSLFLLTFPTSLWAYLYKAEVIKGETLNDKLHFFEDFEFNYRVIKKCYMISLCYDNFYNYIINEGSVNSQNINDRKVTCLEIYRSLSQDIEVSNSALKEKSDYFRAHFLIAIILSLSKSFNIAENKYFQLVEANAREMVSRILISRYVPIKYKISIFLCSLNTKLTTKAINIIKY